MTKLPLLIENRKVGVASGSRSQTVNICTPANAWGIYDWIIRIPKAMGSVTPTEVAEHARGNVTELIEWLTGERDGQIEKKPSEVGEPLEPEPSPQPARNSPGDCTPHEDQDWVERACRITESTIDRLLADFLHAPYRHRVEHSVHAELYSMLAKDDYLCQPLPLLGKDHFTQSLHKEWPEVKARPDKDNRRGLFDLALLSPVAVSRCRAEDFEGGWIRPPIVVELGLNYNEAHLFNDAEKLLNSQIEHGYLVHLVRGKTFDGQHINKRLLQPVDGLMDGRIKVVVAAVDADRKRWIKRIADERVQAVT